MCYEGTNRVFFKDEMSFIGLPSGVCSQLKSSTVFIQKLPCDQLNFASRRYALSTFRQSASVCVWERQRDTERDKVCVCVYV